MHQDLHSDNSQCIGSDSDQSLYLTRTFSILIAFKQTSDYRLHVDDTSPSLTPLTCSLPLSQSAHICL